MRWPRWNHIDLLRYAGFFTYACVGLPLLVETLDPPRPLAQSAHLGWLFSYLVFGLAYGLLTRNLGALRRNTIDYLQLILMSASAIGVSYFSQSGLAGILLLVISGVLPWLLSVRWGFGWLLLETVALIPAMRELAGGWFYAVFQCALYMGFASFTFVTSWVAKAQAEARDEQRRLNAELRATRVLLADSSRMSERVRISRELHDLLGNRLTALCLNLEVASHLVAGQAQDHVRQSQALARLLLSDVREAVSQLREDDIDFPAALRALTEGLPEPQVHVEIAPQFRIEHPRQAQVFIRCAQESITNAIRHAQARNLWLRFDVTPEQQLRMRAEDDGAGGAQWVPGNGLNGMRERLEKVGGKLHIHGAPARGFALEATMPREVTV